MASEDDADRAREARVPRDGPVPGSLVSSEPAGPGGLVATGTAARPVDAHADPSGSGASPLDPGAADAIARELARGEEPEEGRADIPDDDRS